MIMVENQEIAVLVRFDLVRASSLRSSYVEGRASDHEAAKNRYFIFDISDVKIGTPHILIAFYRNCIFMRILRMNATYSCGLEMINLILVFHSLQSRLIPFFISAESMSRFFVPSFCLSPT